MAKLKPLSNLKAGDRLLVGNQAVEVDAQLAAEFQAGDSLYAVPGSGEVLLIPAREQAVARAAVDKAWEAFDAMASATDQQIAEFFAGFAERLADDKVWRQVADVNAQDVAEAKARGRSVTRLIASDALRQGMIDGLRGWIDTESKRGQVLETVHHEGFRVELVGAALGVVGFVFEGRPNVVADATGVLRGGNTVVFRIGRDALRTAERIVALGAAPALRTAGLPEGAVTLLESPAHAAGWALFSDSRLSLAVARGSGAAVDTLGSLARTAGVAVSLHGTGGAWIVAGETASEDAFRDIVVRSLDRKVCNTLNTACIVRSEAKRLVPAFLAGLKAAGERRGQEFKLHVVEQDVDNVPAQLFEREVEIARAEGRRRERQAEPIAENQLGREWEWEDSPEVTLKIVSEVAEAVTLFNRYSPRFVASLVSSDAEEQERFYQGVNAPFVGDGFTRWVDGQYALRRPELGLSNWQHGRLFARGGILSGDSMFTVRTRFRTET